MSEHAAERRNAAVAQAALPSSRSWLENLVSETVSACAQLIPRALARRTDIGDAVSFALWRAVAISCIVASGCAATHADLLLAQLDRTDADSIENDEAPIEPSLCPNEFPDEDIFNEDPPQPQPSPSGRYALTVCTSGYTHRLQVRRLVDGHVTVIDPNPGGGTGSSFQALFTPGDNILTGWGCGTYCAVNVLYSPEGMRLGNWDAYSLSPSGIYAVTFPIVAHPHEADLDVVDLRNGIVVHEEHHSDFELPCDVAWESGTVTLTPCDSEKSLIALPSGEP